MVGNGLMGCLPRDIEHGMGYAVALPLVGSLACCFLSADLLTCYLYDASAVCT